MNKQDLARILIRILGVSMVAHGVPTCVVVLISICAMAGESRFDTCSLALANSASVFLSLAIGLYLIFKGSWIAKKLVHIDDTKDT